VWKTIAAVKEIGDGLFMVRPQYRTTPFIVTHHLAQPVLAILVESAAIWTYVILTPDSDLTPNKYASGWVVFFAAAYQTRSVLRFLAKDLMPQVVALTNMSIHLRVGLGWSRTAQETDRSGPGLQMTSNASMVRVTIQDRLVQPESHRQGPPVDGK
jgi:hypothetical protein